MFAGAFVFLAAVSPAAWQFLAVYQKTRILTFLSPANSSILSSILASSVSKTAFSSNLSFKDFIGLIMILFIT